MSKAVGPSRRTHVARRHPGAGTEPRRRRRALVHFRIHRRRLLALTIRTSEPRNPLAQRMEDLTRNCRRVPGRLPERFRQQAMGTVCLGRTPYPGGRRRERTEALGGERRGPRARHGPRRRREWWRKAAAHRKNPRRRVQVRPRVAQMPRPPPPAAPAARRRRTRRRRPRRPNAKRPSARPPTTKRRWRLRRRGRRRRPRPRPTPVLGLPRRELLLVPRRGANPPGRCRRRRRRPARPGEHRRRVRGSVKSRAPLFSLPLWAPGRPRGACRRRHGLRPPRASRPPPMLTPLRLHRRRGRSPLPRYPRDGPRTRKDRRTSRGTKSAPPSPPLLYRGHRRVGGLTPGEKGAERRRSVGGLRRRRNTLLGAATTLLVPVERPKEGRSVRRHLRDW